VLVRVGRGHACELLARINAKRANTLQIVGEVYRGSIQVYHRLYTRYEISEDSLMDTLQSLEKYVRVPLALQVVCSHKVHLCRRLGVIDSVVLAVHAHADWYRALSRHASAIRKCIKRGLCRTYSVQMPVDVSSTLYRFRALKSLTESCLMHARRV
jgi:hypothetical protein